MGKKNLALTDSTCSRNAGTHRSCTNYAAQLCIQFRYARSMPSTKDTRFRIGAPKCHRRQERRARRIHDAASAVDRRRHIRNTAQTRLCCETLRCIRDQCLKCRLGAPAVPQSFANYYKLNRLSECVASGVKRLLLRPFRSQSVGAGAAAR